MKLIKKVWVRILISMIAGGMFTEFIHIRTGDPTKNYVFSFGIIFFIFLSVLIWAYNYFLLYKAYSSSKEKVNDDILDG